MSPCVECLALFSRSNAGTASIAMWRQEKKGSASPLTLSSEVPDPSHLDENLNSRCLGIFESMKKRGLDHRESLTANVPCSLFYVHWVRVWGVHCWGIRRQDESSGLIIGCSSISERLVLLFIRILFDIPSWDWGGWIHLYLGEKEGDTRVWIWMWIWQAPLFPFCTPSSTSPVDIYSVAEFTGLHSQIKIHLQKKRYVGGRNEVVLSQRPVQESSDRSNIRENWIRSVQESFNWRIDGRVKLKAESSWL